MKNDDEDVSLGCLKLVALFFGITIISVIVGLIFNGEMKGEDKTASGALRFWFFLTVIVGSIFIYRTYFVKKDM